MRLLDLEPRWLSETLFVFRCPHCRKAWLSCKTMAMSIREQMIVFEQAFGDDISNCTPSKAVVVWRVSSRDFSTMSVHPSIDASPSGCWHGFIKAGKIEGGVQT